MITFKDLEVDSRILQAITELGFERPMPVQAEVLPILFSSETDMVALAQTGTGKTAAFGIPIIQKLDLTNKDTEALVLSPTRELCIQIANDLSVYSKYIPQVTVVPVYGGASIEMQQKALLKGAKIIVATPGRMLDLLKRGNINLSNLQRLVLDEADEMLNMGFKDDLDAILERASSDRQTLLFSATMSKEIAAIAKNYMNDPVEITIGEKNSSSQNIRHFYCLTQPRSRYLALKRIVDFYPDIYSIIFCRTKMDTQEVAAELMRDGYNADALHGDLSQAQRDYVMSRFRLRNIQILVATDVAARGLDVNNLTHVINYNLPDDVEQYTHRSGRTGRADKQGISIAILGARDKHKIFQIEKKINTKFTQMHIPTGEEVCKKQLFKVIENIENVDLNETEIQEYFPVISKRLEFMSKDELIKRVVSVEFNRFLDYYRDAKDLNVDEKAEGHSDKRDRGDRGERRDRGERGDRERSPRRSGGKFTRIAFGLGYKDKIVPQRLIGMINDFTRNRDIAIGKIDIQDEISYIEISDQHVKDVLDAFQKANYRGKRFGVEVANKNRRSGSSSGSSDRNRGSRAGDDRDRRKEKPRDKDKGKPKRRF